MAGLLGLAGRVQAQGSGGRRAVHVTGGVSAYAGLYSASGIQDRNQSAPLGLTGQVTVNLPGGVQLPFTFVLGNQGTSFRQPFNLFGVSPRYKWITVHAGYRNLTFSPYTLAGQTFLGGGVELTPGKFRFAAIYGRFNRAIERNLADPSVLPSYSRKGYAVKVGVGSASNFVDFIYLKAADDSASIREGPDSTGLGVRPAENAVAGLTGRFLIAKRLTAEFDAAGSAYTRDVRVAAVSLGDATLDRIASAVITPRSTTQLTTALSGGLGYRSKFFTLKLLYKRIEPNYLTMGAYYFQSDIVSYTVAPSFTLWRGKLRLSGSYGIQEDNLALTKRATSGRRIGSVQVSLNPLPKFGLDVQFTNYGISQQAGARPLIDTLKIAQQNLAATVSVRYVLSGTTATAKSVQTVMLTTTYQNLQDLNPRLAAQTENRNLNLNVSYLFQHTATGRGANLTLSYTTSDLPRGGELVFAGPTVGGSLPLAKRKLNASATFSYLFNRQTTEETGTLTGQVINASGRLAWQLPARQALALQTAYIHSNTGLANQAFNEIRTALEYGITF